MLKDLKDAETVSHNSRLPVVLTYSPQTRWGNIISVMKSEYLALARLLAFIYFFFKLP